MDRPFADMIRLRRKSLGITLHDLASVMDWTIPHLSALERGVEQPTRDPTTLCELAAALRLDVGAVLEAAAAQTARVDAHETAIVQAAAAYVAALKANAWTHDALRREEEAQRELVRAVEGLGEAHDNH